MPEADTRRTEEGEEPFRVPSGKAALPAVSGPWRTVRRPRRRREGERREAEAIPTGTELWAAPGTADSRTTGGVRAGKGGMAWYGEDG